MRGAGFEPAFLAWEARVLTRLDQPRAPDRFMFIRLKELLVHAYSFDLITNIFMRIRNNISMGP